MRPSLQEGTEAWNSGVIYAGEINFGNRGGDRGLLRSVYSAKWIGGYPQ